MVGLLILFLRTQVILKTQKICFEEKNVGQTLRFAESHKNGSRKLQLAYITLLEDLRKEMVSLSANRQARVQKPLRYTHM